MKVGFEFCDLGWFWSEEVWDWKFRWAGFRGERRDKEERDEVRVLGFGVWGSSEERESEGEEEEGRGVWRGHVNRT